MMKSFKLQLKNRRLIAGLFLCVFGLTASAYLETKIHPNPDELGTSTNVEKKSVAKVRNRHSRAVGLKFPQG